MAGIFDGLLGAVAPPTAGSRQGQGQGPGQGPEWDRNDRSHRRSWSKGRGHKAWGKGRKNGKQH